MDEVNERGKEFPLKKSFTARHKSSSMIGQQEVKKWPVKPSGPGALSADRENTTPLISSLDGIAQRPSLSTSLRHVGIQLSREL